MATRGTCEKEGSMGPSRGLRRAIQTSVTAIATTTNFSKFGGLLGAVGSQGRPRGGGDLRAKTCKTWYLAAWIISTT